jgi:3-deoxy-D-manno-octulosonic-acid transferase
MWSLVHDIFVAIVLGLHLIYRALRGIFRRDSSGREYAASRAGLRIGALGTSRKNDTRPLIWLHGVSVGEVAALDRVIAEIRTQTGGKVAIAVSTMTSDGLRAAQRLAHQPDLAFIYPLDLSWFARRIVRELRPRVLVIVDGDFWFQMMRACRRAGIPVVVINGRLSEKSAHRYGRVPSYARQLFSGVASVSVQAETMAGRFARFIPRSRIVVDGNLKLDLQPAALSEDRRVILRRRLGIDPLRLCFVFGSIHPAELNEIAEPIKRLLGHHAHVQVVIAPRHPDKFLPAVLEQYFPSVPSAWFDEDIFDQDGSDRREADRDESSDAREKTARLIWVNRLGVLRDLYPIAGAAFVGGTFCDVGGHNLAEPALAGVPVIYGPDVHAQLPLHELLEAYGASKQVPTRDDLYPAMAAMVDDPALREKMAWNASRLRRDSEGLTARIASRILESAGLCEAAKI